MLLDSIECKNLCAIDIGCGNGLFTKIIAHKFKTILSIDINKIRVDTFRKYCKENSINNVEVQQMNAYAIDRADATFDAVLFFRSIDHIQDYKKVLREGKRILKKNGLVYINMADTRVSTPMIEVLDKFRAFEDNLYDVLEIGEGMCEVKKVDIDELEKELALLGFTIFREEVNTNQNAQEYLQKIRAKADELLEKIKIEKNAFYNELRIEYERQLENVKMAGIDIRPILEIICYN